MTEDEAQALHDERQQVDEDHDQVGCWCCCWTCEFNWRDICTNDE